MVEENRWTCKFCHKSFSPNYKYKNHLSKCLVYTEKIKKEQEIMLELKQELKQELKDELKQSFVNIMDDIKLDMKAQLQQQYQPRRLINAF